MEAALTHFPAAHVPLQLCLHVHVHVRASARRVRSLGPESLIPRGLDIVHPGEKAGGINSTGFR